MCKISYILFLVCFSLSSSVGCKPNHRYVYKKFSVSNMDTNDVTSSCSISLSGSEQYVGTDKETRMSLSYFQSPYTVLVSFCFPKEQSGVVELKNVSFFVNDTLIRCVDVNRKEEFDNKTEFRKGGVPHIREEKESRASFLIKQVVIPHSKQKVLITALISTDKGEVVKTWTFELTPVVEEELRNDQRDSIMSV